jgi:hypothetical protein
MKKGTTTAPDSARLAELRRREKQALHQPTAESYLELADAYHALGLVKESDRLLQLAESYENSGPSPARGLLSGAANPVMLIEVIQILSRTKSTGDFVIDTQAETFHLFFDRGQIINASSQSEAPGMPSFRRALRVASGNYRFVQLPAHNLPRLIEGGTEILLLDAMHEEDLGAAARLKHEA